MQASTVKSPGRILLAAVVILFSSCRPAERPVDVLVLAPLDVELAAATAALASGTASEIAGRDAFVGVTPSGARVAILRTGWGKAHVAGAAAAGIRQFKPRRIVVAGIGGGIDGADVEPGDVVVGTHSFQHDLGIVGPAGGLQRWPPESTREQPYPARFVADTSIVKELEHAARLAPFEHWAVSECECRKNVQPCDPEKRPVDRDRPEVHLGVIATGDVFVADPVRVAQLRSDGAIAIDMEAAAAAQEALNQDVPFATVRVIADIAGRSESEALYHCVKPHAAKRLESVLRAWLR